MAFTFDASSRTGIALAQAFSHGAIAVLLLTAMFAARDASRTLQGRLLLFLTLSVAALEASSGPGSALLPGAVRLVLGLGGILNVALLWLFCLSLLRDDFRFKAMQWVGSAALIAGPALVLAGNAGVDVHPVAGAFSAAAPFVAIAHIAWVAVAERGEDLVPPRRLIRLWVPVALIAAATVSILSEEVQNATMASLIRNGLATLPIGLALLWWLVALDPARLRFEEAVAFEPSRPTIDPRDGVLHAALLAVMQNDHFYREPDVSIDSLAARLSTPTHRLRELINGGLGYRNFAAFINGYRLADAKAAFADPKRARETVLTIAFEAGFASLPTFNRVFRDAEGMTPTAYRTRALAHLSQNQKAPLNS